MLAVTVAGTFSPTTARGLGLVEKYSALKSLIFLLQPVSTMHPTAAVKIRPFLINIIFLSVLYPFLSKDSAIHSQSQTRFAILSLFSNFCHIRPLLRHAIAVKARQKASEPHCHCGNHGPLHSYHYPFFFESNVCVLISAPPPFDRWQCRCQLAEPRCCRRPPR